MLVVRFEDTSANQPIASGESYIFLTALNQISTGLAQYSQQ